LTRISPTAAYPYRMRTMAAIFGYLFGAYLIIRAAMEPFVINMSDPATYRNDWGGPSLAGVLLVHCGPGVLAAILMIRAALRARSRRAQLRQID
jgi:hypothetical protein